MSRPKPRDYMDAMADQNKWSEGASCHGEDPKLFDTVRRHRRTYVSQDNEVARDICADCPVMIRCLERAVRHGEKHGVWGGMVYEERMEWAEKTRPDLLPIRFFAEQLVTAA